MEAMESTLPGRNFGDIKNFTSYCGDAGCQGHENYTIHWDLDQLQPNDNKHKKDKMSYEEVKKKVGKIIIGSYESIILIQQLYWISCLSCWMKALETRLKRMPKKEHILVSIKY